MQQDLTQLSLDFISGFNATEGTLRIEAYDLAKDYLERRFNVILGFADEGESMNDFKDKTKAKDKEERFIRMLAYLTLGSYIEKSLGQLVAIANYQEMNEEELKRRQAQNSTK